MARPRFLAFAAAIVAVLALVAPSILMSSASAVASCPADLFYTGNPDGGANNTQLFHRFNCGAQTEQLTSDKSRMVESADPSPTADEVVVSSGKPDGSSPEDLYILDVATKQSKLLPTFSVGQKMYPRWSPDGQWISFWFNDPSTGLTRGLYIIKTDGTGLRRLTPDNLYGFLGGASWSHSGAQLAMAHGIGSQEGVAVVNFDGTGFHDVEMESGVILSDTPDWTPDDKYIVFTKSSMYSATPAELWMTDLAGSTTKLLNETGSSVRDLTIANDWTMYYIAQSTASTGQDPGHIYRVFLGDLSSRVKMTNGVYGENMPQVARTGSIEAQPSNFPPGTGTTGPSSTPSPTPPPTPKLDNWQDLGDSFASAEGAPGKKGYLPGTDTKQNRCHRSYEANGYQAWKSVGSPANFGFHPCSGAIIEDFFTPFPSNHRDKKGKPVNVTENKAQLDWLSTSTKTVTISVSGNNAHFGDAMEYCATRALLSQPTCESVWGAAVQAAIHNIATGTGKDHDNIPDLYKAIRAKAPNAKIYVRGYPRFFSPTRNASCSTGIRDAFFVPSDIRWINSQTDALNQIISTNAAKYGFVYVDMTDALAGHELCSKNPWINSVKLLSPAESFHPNEAGQASMKRALMGAINR